jgi:GTP cyclohydrolase IA
MEDKTYIQFPPVPADEEMEWHIKKMLELIGENPDREGLKETPKRVAKAWREWFSGLSAPNPEVKAFTNEEQYGDLIIIRDIPFNSMCEHHLAPFIGKATVAYIPSEKYMGLSKAARVLDHFALRPQVQERLTAQVADYLFEALNPQGLLVMVNAEHMCMATRGVKKHGSSTTTTAIRGRIDKSEVLQSLELK